MIPIEAGLWEKMMLVMRVETRQVKAADAARQMRVSRKTFYQWAARGLQGMAAAMASRLAGRPGKARDPESECLRAHNAMLRQENQEFRRTLRIREVLHKPTVDDVRHAEKKTTQAGGGHRGH